MNRAQLERLGPDTLRRLARQIGLPGALHHSRQALLTGLCAYFERRPSTPEDDEEPGDEPSSRNKLPPALATETMARVLEARGKTDQAAALRRQMDQQAQQGSAHHCDEVVIEQAGTDGVTLRFYVGSEPGDAIVEVWFWTEGDPPDVRRLSLTTNEGRLSLEAPAGAHLTCALLCRRAASGSFDPLCRTPVLAIGNPPDAETRP